VKKKVTGEKKIKKDYRVFGEKNTGQARSAPGEAGAFQWVQIPHVMKMGTGEMTTLGFFRTIDPSHAPSSVIQAFEGAVKKSRMRENRTYVP
jgi:hypothetical protein